MELPRPENPEQVERRAPARPRTRLPPRGLRLPIPPSPSPVPLPLPLPRPPPATPAAPGPGPGPGPAPALAPDDVTDPSELERLQILGYGNGGKVYKVRHRRTGAVYALKMVHGNHDEPTRRQMLREMEILRRVDSPFVVRCHGVFDCGGDIQFVLEYMDAGSLDRHHAGRPPALTEAFLAAVARQVLQGLRYLHSRRIVHRDIKPSNLLLNSRGQFKIADFGVSRILSRTLDPCNSCVGTYAYMSPERIDPDATDGRYDGYAGDIWSLGLTLLECYLGRLPLLEPGMAPDWPTLMCAICYGEPPAPPPSASPEFQSFIRCCLHKDPNQRWTASQLLSHPFLAQQ